jgi:hypothetical protein
MIWAIGAYAPLADPEKELGYGSAIGDLANNSGALSKNFNGRAI